MNASAFSGTSVSVDITINVAVDVTVEIIQYQAIEVVFTGLGTDVNVISTSVVFTMYVGVVIVDGRL